MVLCKIQQRCCVSQRPFGAASPSTRRRQLVPGTGGVRKIRWGTPGQGKRSGARVIYYYNESIPLFALDIYAKNQKTDLSEADKRSLKRLLPILVSQYLKRRA